MSTLRQLIFAIRNPVSGGKATRDIGFSDRQIADAIREVKNEILYESCFDKYGKKTAEINPSYQQDLGVLSLESVDITDIPDTNLQWGTTIKKVIIPKPVDLPQNAGIVYFGYLDKLTNIYLPDTTLGDIDNYQQYPRRDNVMARQMGVQDDGQVIYLYGQNIDELCFINARIIADDPLQAMPRNANGTTDTFDWDKTPYPFPTWLEPTLKQKVQQKLFYQNAQLPRDIKDNEKSDAVN